MKQVSIGGRNVPAIIQGCMRIGGFSEEQLEGLIQTQLDLGVNYWDHADIYGQGTCEELFGRVLSRNPVPSGANSMAVMVSPKVEAQASKWARPRWTNASYWRYRCMVYISTMVLEMGVPVAKITPRLPVSPSR